MTPTTGRHISHLINACPFSYLRVPMEYGNHYFSLDACIGRVVKNLDYYSNSKLSIKANREVFINSYNQLIYINNSIKDIDPNAIEQYKPMFELLSNTKEVKELKAKLREKIKQDRIKAEKELNTLLNTYNYLDLAQFAFDIHHAEIVFDDYKTDREMSAKVKRILNPNNDLSFVWIENDNTIKTSKNIKMPMDIVKTGLKLWKHNKIKHGYKIGCYTVLEVRENYVQIGCHKIPIENIKALYEAIYPNKAQKVEALQVA